MKQRVTISFVENTDGTAELETCKGFFESLMGHHLPMWCDVDGGINVSVEPVAEPRDEVRGYATVSDLRRHYGCDAGGAQ